LKAAVLLRVILEMSREPLGRALGLYPLQINSRTKGVQPLEGNETLNPRIGGDGPIQGENSRGRVLQRVSGCCPCLELKDHNGSGSSGDQQARQGPVIRPESAITVEERHGCHPKTPGMFKAAPRFYAILINDPT
jgi:hypothetical protein